MSESRVVTSTDTSIVDLLDRVVHRGAVVNGDVIISLAGIDLIRLDLRLLLVAVCTAAGDTCGATIGSPS